MWQEWFFWSGWFRHCLAHEFWQNYRIKRCEPLNVELYTIARRTKVLVVESKVRDGPFAGKKWSMMVWYDPTINAEARHKAMGVDKLVKDLTRRAAQLDINLAIANFNYWTGPGGFWNHIKKTHPKLRRLASKKDAPLQGLSFVVLW